MLGAIALFEQSFTNIVAITFTSLVLAELLNVASEIQTWLVAAPAAGAAAAAADLEALDAAVFGAFGAVV